MINITKILIASALSILIVGCGGSSDSDSGGIPADLVPKVSNIGNNINGLGYYGSGVLFGDSDIVENLAVFKINDDATTTYQKNLYINADNWRYSNDSSSMSHEGYGVNENGTLLKLAFDYPSLGISGVETYTYVKEIQVLYNHNYLECMQVVYTIDLDSTEITNKALCSY